MDRRAFLGRLFGAAVAVAVAPSILDVLALPSPVAPPALVSCVPPLSAERLALYLTPAVEALRQQIDDRCAQFAYRTLADAVIAPG